ncbi:Cna B-type domain-containing protein [Lactobacillus equicursoris]|uniref:Cna B-type domain-containing protein n=1 Tax=Lactobacillus equicursoris TaxID=420645 RepID=A0A844FNV4_9LACO|nr:Cna B-type domain-containing protein [Lactobacillus equicursoris]MST79862.1 Cna B-type domain-containing protein [Lactobacillus equicursoris]
MRKHKEKKLIRLAHLFAALILTLSILVPSFVEVGQAVWSPANAVAADKNSDQNNDSYNLADKKWITNIEVDQIKNGNKEKVDLSKPLEDGSNIAVVLQFKIPKDSVKGNGSKVTYQMPAGFKIDREQSGKIDSQFDSDIKVGTYKVTTDGYVEVTFNEKFDATCDEFGQLKVDGTLQNSSATDNREIKFDGTGTTIVVDNAGDIEVNKSAKVAKDRASIDYTVDVTTKNGTPSTVDVTDELKDATNVKGSYDESSFKIIKKSADNKTTELSTKDYKPVISTNSSNNPTFKISDLPRLEKGESYEITYKVKLDDQVSEGNESIGNTAKSKSGNRDDSKPITTKISDKRVQKLGSYDSNSGQINWTITVNKNRDDISNYKLTDALPDKPEGVSLLDDVTIKDQTDPNNKQDLSKIIVKGKKGDTSISLDFSKLPDKDNLKTHEFQITYSTKAPEASSTGDTKVTNKVDFHDDHHHYSAKDSPTVPKKSDHQDEHHDSDDYDITKNWDSEDSISGNDAEKLYNWHSTLKLAGKELNLLDYTDTIEDPTRENEYNPDDFWSHDVVGSQYHYGVASELYKELTDPNNVELIAEDGSSQTTYKLGKDYSIEAHFYKDKNRDEEVDKTDSQTKVKSFLIRIVPKSGKTIKPTKLVLHYSTHVRVDKIAAGETWTYKNTGYFNRFNDTQVNKHSTDQHEEKKDLKLTKGASSSDSNQPFSYKNADQTFDISETNGKVYYQLLLKVPDKEKGPLEITDILPKGMKYVDGSLTTAIWKDGWNVEKDSDPKASTTTETQTDGTTKLKISLPVGKDRAGKVIVLRYQGSVKDDQSWQDPTQLSKSYVNKVSWNGQSDEQKTTFKDEKSIISKTATQLKDSDGNPKKTVSYQVNINTAAKDLNPDGDTVLLNDKITSADNLELSLNLQTVKLYKYDPNSEDHRGAEVDPSLYTFKYDNDTHEIKMELPDRFACVLVYQYDFDAGDAKSPTISNTASLAGKTSGAVTTQLTNSHSAASIYAKKISIYKMDSDNNAKLLPNAQFEVKKLDEDKWQDVQATDIASKKYRTSDGKLVTDSDGRLNLTGFDSNTVYCVNETKAPDGYSINKNTYYLVWLEDKSAKDVYDGLSDTVKKEIGGQDKIHFFKTTGAIYVPDQYTQLKVAKKWVDSDGTAAKPGASNVKVDLYRVTKKMNAIKVKVVLYNPNFGKYENSKDNNPFFEEEYQVEKGTSITIHGDAYGNTPKYEWLTINGINQTVDPNAGTYTSPKLNSDTTIVAKTNNWVDTEKIVVEKEDPQPIMDQTTKTKVETVTLDASNNWQKTWDKLPHEDENGNTYYYKVEEESVPGYKTSYRNNDGVKYGQIDVINQEKNEVYHLPQSGGRGLYAFLVLGTAIVASGLAFRRKKFN